MEQLVQTLIPILIPLCIGGLVFLAVVAVVWAILRLYKTAGPDEVLVVSGFRGPRYVNNAGTIVLPILNTTRKLDVRVISIQVDDDEIPTADHINAVVSWVAKAKFVVDNHEMMANAAQLFADLDRGQIVQEIEDTLSQNIREIVATLTAVDLHSKRNEFVQRVQEIVHDDSNSQYKQ